jgi:predicted acylesterase/phospholipase RssA
MPADHFRVLSLDGGGARGFYSLGVLHEIEGMSRRKRRLTSRGRWRSWPKRSSATPSSTR